MAHNRNLISNGNPMEAIVGFSRAVRVGQFIAVGGTAPVDKDGNTVGVGDVFLQTKQCFEIIKAALEDAGSGLHDIVRTRVILTNIDDWKQAIENYEDQTIELLEGPPLRRSAVQDIKLLTENKNFSLK